MYLILAGSYEQFRNCLREHKIDPKNARYVTSASDIAGYHKCTIIRYGTWKSLDYKKNWKSIEESLRAAEF